MDIQIIPKLWRALAQHHRLDPGDMRGAVIWRASVEEQFEALEDRGRGERLAPQLRPTIAQRAPQTPQRLAV